MLLWLTHWARNFLWDAQGTASGDVVPSPSMILVCRGQGRPWQYILAVWIPFIRPRAFLHPQRGPGARYEMG